MTTGAWAILGLLLAGLVVLTCEIRYLIKIEKDRDKDPWN